MSRASFSIFFFGICVLVGLLFLVFGYTEILHVVWNIPTMKPYFADIRTITGVNDTIALGLDPLVNNPGDPWHRAMNYPRIWQYVAELSKMDQSFGVYFGLLNVTLYVIGFYVFALRIKMSRLMGFLFLITFFSPASVLAMERGNIDIVMFFLLSLSLCYICKPIIYSTIVMIASILKIFPIFAMVGLVRSGRDVFVKLFFGITLLFSGYLVLVMDDVLLIKRATPQAFDLSYGLNVLWMGIGHYFGAGLGLLCRVATYLFISALTVYFFMQKKHTAVDGANTFSIDAFRVGGAVFIATFLLSNNWDYRLIFLILTIPQLVTWMISDAEKIIRVAAFVAISATVGTMWYLVMAKLCGNVAWIIDEISNLMLFSALFFLLIVTLPRWISDLAKISKKHE